MGILFSDGTEFNGGRRNIGEQVAGNGVIAAPAVKLEADSAEMFKDIAVKYDVVCKDKGDISGSRDDMLIVADVIDGMARADEKLSALI